MNRKGIFYFVEIIKGGSYFTLIFAFALFSSSCNPPAHQTNSSQNKVIQSSRTREEGEMPLTNSAPPDLTITPTISVSSSQSVTVTPTPTPTPRTFHTTTIDDSVQGTDMNEFNYVGKGWQHDSSECPGYNCHGPLPYAGTNSWDITTNDSVAISFTGIRILLYGIVDAPHGIGAVSLDGGSETMIDFYAPARAGNHLLWTSPIVSAGPHTFKLRVTGTKNLNSSNTAVVPDRVDILS